MMTEARLASPDKSQAVLIAVSDYEHLDDIPATANNVTDLARLLRSDNVWGLKPSHCQVLINPRTTDDVLEAVHQAALAATDTLVVYFAGHGLVDRNHELYLGLSGADKTRLHKAVPYPRLRDEITKTGAHTAGKVVLLDCCFSGRALTGSMGSGFTVADQASLEGSYLMTAVPETSLAWAPPGQRYTAFTGALIDVIRQGVPGAAPVLSMDSLFWPVRSALSAQGLPSPQSRARNEGSQIAIALNRHYPAGAAKPPPAGTTDPPQRTVKPSAGYAEPTAKNTKPSAGYAEPPTKAAKPPAGAARSTHVTPSSRPGKAPEPTTRHGRAKSKPAQLDPGPQTASGLLENADRLGLDSQGKKMLRAAGHDLPAAEVAHLLTELGTINPQAAGYVANGAKEQEIFQGLGHILRNTTGPGLHILLDELMTQPVSRLQNFIEKLPHRADELLAAEVVRRHTGEQLARMYQYRAGSTVRQRHPATLLSALRDSGDLTKMMDFVVAREQTRDSFEHAKLLEYAIRHPHQLPEMLRRLATAQTAGVRTWLVTSLSSVAHDCQAAFVSGLSADPTAPGYREVLTVILNSAHADQVVLTLHQQGQQAQAQAMIALATEILPKPALAAFQAKLRRRKLIR